MRWLGSLIVLVAAGCGIEEPDFWAFSSGSATVVSGSGRTVTGGFTGVAIWTSDSPLDEVDAVHVAFDRVEFLRGDTRLVLLDRRRRMNLLELQNGVRRLLAEGEAAPGTYHTLRVRLASGGGLPHAIERGGVTEPLRLAPGAPDEFLFEGPFRFRPDEVLELQLDFNVRLSVYEADGTWYLAPHGTLHDPRLAAAIEGTALPAGTRVSAQVAGREVASTTSRSDGFYRLFPLRAGTYDLVASRAGYRPEVERAVRVERAATSGGHHFLLEPAGASGSLRGYYFSVGGRGLVARLYWDGTLVGIAGVDPQTGGFAFPLVPADEFAVEIWDHTGPLGTRRPVLVESDIDALLEFD